MLHYFTKKFRIKSVSFYDRVLFQLSKLASDIENMFNDSMKIKQRFIRSADLYNNLWDKKNGTPTIPFYMVIPEEDGKYWFN